MGEELFRLEGAFAVSHLTPSFTDTGGGEFRELTHILTAMPQNILVCVHMSSPLQYYR